MNAYTRRRSCRLCGAPEPTIFLSLGPLPLANALLPEGEEGLGDAFPLDVGLCASCGLVQTPDVVDPSLLFSTYPYMTGVSRTMRAHFTAYADAVVGRAGLGEGARVVEVGSNDGSLLAAFKAGGARVLGIDPAANVAAVARARGVPTEICLFDPGVADAIRRRDGPAAVVVANNVVAHVDDPVGFLSACVHLVDGEGLVVVEVPHLRGLVDALAWDTLYHEHLSYFSATSFAALAAAAGLGITAVGEVPVHGGSLRLWMRPGAPHGDALRRAVEAEASAGLTSLGRLAAFAAEVDRSADAIHAWAVKARAAGRRVAGYGAAAKATVLVNRARLDRELLPWVVDANPLKVGRRLPGTGTPIRDVNALSTDRPDEVLVFAWNLFDEISAQQEAFVSGGGRLLRPLPAPRPPTG